MHARGQGYDRGMTATTLALPARYRGTELIATGGMADVYAATDDTLDRRVAIKVLNERFAGDPEIRARFTREARIAARLSIEPNVVTIFDVADVGGQPAIVMEFLPGGTLADRMQRGPRSPGARALRGSSRQARALDAAHAAGVVHRDVKPANLMLGADGEVRVTDFGIARIAGDVVADERRARSSAPPATCRRSRRSGARRPLRATATGSPSSRSSCSAAAGRTWPRPSQPRPRRTRRRRSRPRRASTVRCLSAIDAVLGARARQGSRRSATARAASWSRA